MSVKGTHHELGSPWCVVGLCVRNVLMLCTNKPDCDFAPGVCHSTGYRRLICTVIVDEGDRAYEVVKSIRFSGQ